MLAWTTRVRHRLGCYGSVGTGCLAGCLGVAALGVLLLTVVVPAVNRYQRGNFDLYRAIAAGDSARVAQLLAGGADPNDASLGNPRWTRGEWAGPTPDTWHTPLIFAVDARRADLVRLLLAHGADVRRTKGSHGRVLDRYPGGTALYAAVGAGDAALVELLLARGADANDRTMGTRWPVLCDAAGAGHARIVGALLARGADPDARCYRDVPAAVVARRAGHAAVAAQLRRAGARE
jgi:hypothetical protein